MERGADGGGCRLAAARDAGGPGRGRRARRRPLTNEGAYAWAKLAKGVIGTDSVDAQLGDGLPAELVLALPRATIDEACSAKTVVLLTGDVREELPVLFLRLRQAALEGGTALVELAPRPTSLSRYAAVSVAARPGDAPPLARALTGDDGAASSLQSHPEGPAWHPEDLARARAAARSRRRAGDGVVVVLGRPSVAEHEGVMAEAARVLATALPGARFLPVLRRGNVHGALDMGLAPGLLPGRVGLDGGRRAGSPPHWGSVPAGRGLDAAGILAIARPTGPTGVRALVAARGRPDRRLPRPPAGRAGPSAAADFVVAVTGHPSPTVDRADVVLPVAVAHERPGTTTNVEGRVSRLGQKLVAPGLAWPDWMIAAELAVALGGDLRVGSVSELWEEIERLAPAYAGLTPAVLDSDAERDGVLVPFDAAARASAGARRADRPGGSAGRGVGGAPGGPAPGRPSRVAAAEMRRRPATRRRGRRRRRRPCWPQRRAAGRARRTCRRPTATRCGWCRPAASTTPACGRRLAVAGPAGADGRGPGQPLRPRPPGRRHRRPGAGPLGPWRPGAAGRGRRRACPGGGGGRVQPAGTGRER